MKLAFNGATTMKADLATDLEAARQAGFDLLEIWAAKLRTFLKSNAISDLKNLFVESGVPPLSINSIEHITFRNPDDFAKLKEECEELSSIASELGCPYLVVVPGKMPARAPSREEIIEKSAEVLSQLGSIAEKHGVGLGFEFLGQADCSVQTLGLAAEVVNAVALPNIGLVIDSFHFYAGGSTIDMIDDLDPERLFIFHINDAANLPREQLQDSHRLLPGLGVLPLREMLKAFRRIGYDRVASVEIFRPEYWEWDPMELARQAYLATNRVLETVKPRS
ncbi:MAG: sugar phosphate isomerase/epimerase family protein [Pyrinomonadaceae bacterium]